MTALALAPGDVIALTLNERRRLFEISGLVDTQARQVTARSIDPDVFAVPLLAPDDQAAAGAGGARAGAGTRAGSACHRWRQCRCADAARCVRQSVAGLGGDMAIEGRREFPGGRQWRRRLR